MPDADPSATRVAIVGAGIAGASAARILAAAGIDVELFDKARGPGGRLATRRVSVEGRTFSFDHGAQWTMAKGEAFQTFLDAVAETGAVAPWAAAPARGGVVGVPGMNALVRFGLGDAPLTAGFTVTELARGDDGWRLSSAEGMAAGPFDGVILTVPAPQLPPIIAPHVPEFAAAAADAEYDPCWTLMLAFDDALAPRLADISDDALARHGLEWIAFNGGKPGREGATLVIHAGGDLSRYQLEISKDEAAQKLTALATEGLDLPKPVFAQAHRWRYARVASPSRPTTLFDNDATIGIAGDWCAGPFVEDAFDAGAACARACVAALQAPD